VVTESRKNFEIQNLNKGLRAFCFFIMTLRREELDNMRKLYIQRL
jgi:hypothetical protein